MDGKMVGLVHESQDKDILHLFLPLIFAVENYMLMCTYCVYSH